MRWTRMLGGAIAVSAALLLPATGALAQVPGQCDASAQGCTSEQAPPGPGGDTKAAPGAGGEVVGITAEAGPAAGQESTVGGLAFTGADILGLTALGLGFVALGTVLVRRSRRPQSA